MLWLKLVTSAVILSVTCEISGCSMPLPRTEEEKAADAVTAAKVESALLADTMIYARHIDVSVNRGTVHLGGYVWSNEEFQQAKKDAASIPGVTSVATEMELMRGGISGTSR
jgi:osmotically-inducible protein OsmY